MRLSLYAPSADEPITLKEAKKQCEIEADEKAHDAFLRELAIPAARERAEDATWRQMLTATWDLTLDGFPACGSLELPKAPLQAVVSVSYVDSDGVTVTFSPTNYAVTAPVGPKAARGHFALGYGLSWPTPRDQAGSVVVRFRSGYGDDPEAVPARLRMAMLRDVAALFENRENVTTDGKPAVTLPDGSAQVYRAYKSRGR